MKNLYKIEDELYIVSYSEKIQENTQSFKQGLNGDWFYNTIYNFVARTGDITSYDFKIILTTNKLLIKDGVQSIPDDFLEWFVKNPTCEFVETYSLGIENGETGESCHYKYEIIIPKEEVCTCEVGHPYNNTCCKIHGDIPKEEPKQECCKDADGFYLGTTCSSCNKPFRSVMKEETIEEASERLKIKWEIDRPSDFIKGAKLQEQRMYSEEEVFYLVNKLNNTLNIGSDLTLEEWFNQNKKKCKHQNINRVDGLDECLDCGTKNY